MLLLLSNFIDEETEVQKKICDLLTDTHSKPGSWNLDSGKLTPECILSTSKPLILSESESLRGWCLSASHFIKQANLHSARLWDL